MQIKFTDKLIKKPDRFIDQICAIDNKRLTKGPIAHLNISFMGRIYDAIGEVMKFELK